MLSTAGNDPRIVRLSRAVTDKDGSFRISLPVSYWGAASPTCYACKHGRFVYASLCYEGMKIVLPRFTSGGASTPPPNHLSGNFFPPSGNSILTECELPEPIFLKLVSSHP
jgi:hypothetical protein